MMLPNVTFIGTLPPPTNGLSLVNESVVDRLDKAGLLAVLAPFRPSTSGTLLGRAWSRVRYMLSIPWVLLNPKGRISSVVYLTPAGGPGLVTDVFAACLARLLGKWIILHHHSFSYISGKSTTMKGLVAICGANSTQLFLSELMKQAFEKRYGKCSNSYILPNEWMLKEGYVSETSGAVKGGELGPKDSSNQRAIRIGHLSNLSFAKGLRDVVNILEVLLERGLSVDLTLAGPASTSSELLYIRHVEHLYPKNFTWIGPVSGKEKSAWYAGLDYFLFPSSYKNEAYPMVIIEAMQGGCIVLASNVGSVSEMIPKGQCFDVTNAVAESVAYVEQHGKPQLHDRLEVQRSVRAKADCAAKEFDAFLFSLKVMQTSKSRALE